MLVLDRSGPFEHEHEHHFIEHEHDYGQRIKGKDKAYADGSLGYASVTYHIYRIRGESSRFEYRITT